MAVAKCSIFYLGHLNQRHAYTAFGVLLEVVSVVCDLGVLLSDDLKWFQHTAHIASKASQRANAIFKAVTFSSFEMLANAYVTYIRPFLESASVVWPQHLLQEKHSLESVQRKYTKCLFCRCRLQATSYENRLEHLGWPTLEAHHGHADLCLAFSLLKGFTVRANNMLVVARDRFALRGNETGLKGAFARLYVYVNISTQTG